MSIDRRVRRTNKLLQQALNDLLAEKDLHSITVQEIAERAEVNRATFYARFTDKYDLLNYSVREQFVERLNAKTADWSAFTAANVRQLIVVLHEYMSAFAGHCAPPMKPDDDAMMMIPLQNQVYDIVLAWMQSDDKPEVSAMAVSWAIFGTVFQWTRLERRVDSDYVADQVLKRVLPMLTASAMGG